MMAFVRKWPVPGLVKSITALNQKVVPDSQSQYAIKSLRSFR